MSIPVWYGPYAAAAVLLIGAGAAKVWRPRNTANALRSARLGGSEWVVRIGALAEVVIGGTALTGARIAAALLTASYLAFAGFVAWALREGSPVSSCGCFGEPDAAPTRGHVLLNLGAAALGAAATIGPLPPLADVLRAQPLRGVPLLLLTAVTAYLAFLAMTLLPRLASARRRKA